MEITDEPEWTEYDLMLVMAWLQAILGDNYYENTRDGSQLPDRPNEDVIPIYDTS